MTDTQHRATPEQWADIQKHAGQTWLVDACLLELRDRLAAAEQRISELEGATEPQITPPREVKLITAPTRSLVEFVAQAVATDSDQPLHVSAIAEWAPEAKAAILAVAEWLDSRGVITKVRAARLLRQEVERG